MYKLTKYSGIALYRIIFIADILLTVFCAILIKFTLSQELYYDIVDAESRNFWYGFLRDVQITCGICAFLSLFETLLVDHMLFDELEQVIRSKSAIRRRKRLRVEQVILMVAFFCAMNLNRQILGGDGHVYTGDLWFKEIGFKAVSIFILLIFEKFAHIFVIEHILKIQGKTW